MSLLGGERFAKISTLARKPNDVWVEGARGNVCLVYASKSGNPDKAAYLNEYLKEARDPNSPLVKDYMSVGPFKARFMGVIARRSPSGENCEMAQSVGSKFTYFQLAFVFQGDDDEENTPENREYIGRKIARDITEIAAQRFKWPDGDRTDPESLPPPLTRR